MRKIAIISAIAAVTLLSGTGSAGAATGTLTINGVVYTDPSGCLIISDGPPVNITNDTDQPVTVYIREGCNELVSGAVGTGQSNTLDGKSVSIP